MNLSKVDFWYFGVGKEGHRIIQDHIAGIKKDDRLKDLTCYFPIVEVEKFDPRCKFQFDIDEASVIGYFDGRNPEEKRLAEIKISNTLWSIDKYYKSMQRKINVTAFPDHTDCLLITASHDLSKVKTAGVPATDKDRDEAREWIRDTLKIINSGKFEKEGEAVDCQRCVYQLSCPESSYGRKES
jgi:hypothetical protein